MAAVSYTHLSGKFCANNRHISKRGNRYLRKTGYEVMQSYVMHKPANDPIFTFIEKKRGEGKSGKLAMVAGLNKFLRIYYGKVTELYRDVYKRQAIGCTFHRGDSSFRNSVSSARPARSTDGAAPEARQCAA